jgi:hypothetical protein
MSSKREAPAQIGKRYRRQRILNRDRVTASVHEAAKKAKKSTTSSSSLSFTHAHQVAFSASERLDERILEVHHQMSASRNHPITLSSFLEGTDPAKKVWIIMFSHSTQLISR